MTSVDTGCGHRGCTADAGDRWLTTPNVITWVRLVATVALCGVATQASEAWLLAALAAYWIGDLADGIVARAMGAETRTGAVLDILADRLSVCLIVTVYAGDHVGVLVPAGIFLVQFVVLDAYLSMAFLGWSLSSPNYFGLVDARIHRWNWSAPAKATNTAAVVIIWLVTQSPAVTSVAAVAVLAAKSATAVRMARLKRPTVRTGCAVDESRVIA